MYFEFVEEINIFLFYSILNKALLWRANQTKYFCMGMAATQVQVQVQMCVLLWGSEAH
jgi:peptide deformylase